MEVLKVIRFRNQPVDSNCYVLFTDYSSECIIVDLGTADCCELLSFLKGRDLYPGYIILTHEHFDHIAGVNILRQQYDLQVIASALCSTALTDRKKNMSVFYDGVGFTVGAADRIVEDSDLRFVWQEIVFEFLLTPGHTKASISFLADRYLFTGDTFIKGLKTVTKLPTGSVSDLKKSIGLLRQKAMEKDCVIKCGHGEDAVIIDLEEYDKIFRPTESDGKIFR